MTKKVTFAPKPAVVGPPNADAWVSGARAAATEEPQKVSPPEPIEKAKRFTFDVPESLHRRVKTRCAEMGVDMKEEMLRILREHFPQV
jgi:hypothetical protein